jgi:HD-GYP domain-containing protein (c-di-GMP phosphodiesterase class II)
VIQGAALNPSASRAPASSSKSVEFLEVLAETIENRDEYMRGHARRVAFYTGLLSERLCMSAEKRELIRISAFLHDLGKVGIPSEVASQASALLPAQRVQVEEHPDIGERLIRPLSFSGRIASGIRHHHERWDGGGYPDRLAGADIPLVARMIAIADAFDAMTCERPYRGRKSVDDAVHELNKHAGSQFDPHLVEEFVQIIESGVADCMEEDFGQPQTYSELRA